MPKSIPTISQSIYVVQENLRRFGFAFKRREWEPLMKPNAPNSFQVPPDQVSSYSRPPLGPISQPNIVQHQSTLVAPIRIPPIKTRQETPARYKE